jgi:tetratricopeptide (TPR) repeat protein
MEVHALDYAGDHATLARLRGLLMQGDFVELKNINAIPILKKISERHAKSDGQKRGVDYQIDRLQALCLRSELEDYWGAAENASGAISFDAHDLLATLPSARPMAVAHKALYFQMIWLLVHWAHASYRKGDLGKADEVLALCESELQKVLPTPVGHTGIPTSATDADWPYGLISRLAYSKARVARQRGDLKEARGLYTKALETQYRRLEQKAIKHSGDKLRLVREQAHTTYVVAKCMGFGLAWIALKSGELARAHASLGAARALLRTTNDTIHKGYVDLLYAQTLRAKATDDNQGLLEAQSILRELLKTTFRYARGYEVRARVELARTCYLLGRSNPEDLKHAKHEIDSLIKGVPRSNRPWRFYTGILKSRILRNESLFAPPLMRHRLLKHASKLAQAGVSGMPGPELSIGVIARIELAEVHIEMARQSSTMGHLDKAEHLLMEAMEKGSGNPLDVGVCHLHLCRTASRGGDVARAIHQFRQWQQYAGLIENGFALTLAREVQEEVFRGDQAFVVRADDGPFKYWKEDQNFRMWLLKQAKDHLGERFGQEGPNYLGIARGTFFKWRKDLNFHPPA